MKRIANRNIANLLREVSILSFYPIARKMLLVITFMYRAVDHHSSSILSPGNVPSEVSCLIQFYCAHEMTHNVYPVIPNFLHLVFIMLLTRIDVEVFVFF